MANAEKLAKDLNGKARELSHINDFTEGFDVLITCTAAQSTVITNDIYKSLIGNEDMKKIIIKIGKYDVISLERPDGRYLTPISDLDYKINQGQYRSIFSFGNSKSKSKSKIKETRLNKIHKDIIFLKKLNLN